MIELKLHRRPRRRELQAKAKSRYESSAIAAPPAGRMEVSPPRKFSRLLTIPVDDETIPPPLQRSQNRCDFPTRSFQDRFAGGLRDPRRQVRR